MQMVDIYAVPVFHHGGHFGRGPSGTLEYIGGKVEKFTKMDVDFVNFGDLVILFKGLGYATLVRRNCDYTFDYVKFIALSFPGNGAKNMMPIPWFTTSHN